MRPSAQQRFAVRAIERRPGSGVPSNGFYRTHLHRDPRSRPVLDPGRFDGVWMDFSVFCYDVVTAFAERSCHNPVLRFGAFLKCSA